LRRFECAPHPPQCVFAALFSSTRGCFLSPIPSPPNLSERAVSQMIHAGECTSFLRTVQPFFVAYRFFPCPVKAFLQESQRMTQLMPPLSLTVYFGSLLRSPSPPLFPLFALGARIFWRPLCFCIALSPPADGASSLQLAEGGRNDRTLAISLPTHHHK